MDEHLTRVLHACTAVLIGTIERASNMYKANSAEQASTYTDIRKQGPAMFVGIKSSVRLSMTEQMASDMVAYRTLAGREVPPREVVVEILKEEARSLPIVR